MVYSIQKAAVLRRDIFRVSRVPLPLGEGAVWNFGSTRIIVTSSGYDSFARSTGRLTRTRKSWYDAWKKRRTGLTVLVGTGHESVWQITKFLNKSRNYRIYTAFLGKQVTTVGADWGPKEWVGMAIVTHDLGSLLRTECRSPTTQIRFENNATCTISANLNGSWHCNK